MTPSLEEIIERVRQSPSLVAVDDYEIAIQRVTSHASHFENGVDCATRESSHVWMSLRVIHRKQPGKAAMFVSSPAEASTLVALALEASKSTTADPWFRFPLWRPGLGGTLPGARPRSPLPKATELSRPTGIDADEIYEITSIETKLARKLERSALSFETEEHSVRLQVAFASESGPVLLRDFRAAGLPLDNRGEWLANLIAQGVEQARARPWKLERPQNVLFRPGAVVAVLRAIAPHFFADEPGRADTASRARSFPDPLTIVDDGAPRAGTLVAPFDLEGTPSQRTSLIEKGVVTGLLFDTYHATRENRLSTGNWRRPVDSPYPRIGVTQLLLEPRATSLESLVADLGEGVVLESIDPAVVTGGWISGLGRGWHVSSGRPLAPVFGVPVDWAAADALRSIVSIGNDLDYFGSFAAPSILCRNLPKGS